MGDLCSWFALYMRELQRKALTEVASHDPTVEVRPAARGALRPPAGRIRTPTVAVGAGFQPHILASRMCCSCWRLGTRTVMALYILDVLQELSCSSAATPLAGDQGGGGWRHQALRQGRSRGARRKQRARSAAGARTRAGAAPVLLRGERAMPSSAQLQRAVCSFLHAYGRKPKAERETRAPSQLQLPFRPSLSPTTRAGGQGDHADDQRAAGRHGRAAAGRRLLLSRLGHRRRLVR